MADGVEAKAPLAPFREAKLLPVDLDIERRADGTILITSKIPLRPYNANIPAEFADRANASGDKPALARRGADGEWVYTTFAELKRDMDAATQWLMDQPQQGPVLILAGNTPAFAVMSFAAQASGRGACPVSTTYAALGGDYGRLAHVIDKVWPGVVFAEDSAAAAGAIARLHLHGAAIVTTDPSRVSKPAKAYADVLATTATNAVAKSIAGLKPQDFPMPELTLA